MNGPRPAGSYLIGAQSLGHLQTKRAKAGKAGAERPVKITLPGVDLAAIGKRLSAQCEERELQALAQVRERTQTHLEAVGKRLSAHCKKLELAQRLRWLLVPPVVVPCPACGKRCCFLLRPDQPLVDGVPLVGCSACKGEFKLSDF